MDLSYESDVEFERPGLMKRVMKAAILNPVANYAPAGVVRALLRLGKSELARANWDDPGGWQSMVISYNGRPRQIADRIMVAGGSIPMALRNRRKLAARLLARLIDMSSREPVHVLCLGAGPGYIIMDAMEQSRRACIATLVDLSSDAFDHGRRLAAERGLADRMRYVQGDVRDVGQMLDRPPDVVKMLGICEYLTDEQITDIVRAVTGVMPPRSAIVLNSLSAAHGTDRFFRRVFGLHMAHRDPEQLEALLRPAGFGDFVSIPEPLGVYHVLVGRRAGG